MLLARSFLPLLTFQTVKVTPTRAPPAGAVKAADPFITPTQLVDRPQSVDVRRPQPADRPQSTNKASTDQVPAMQRQMSSTLVTEGARQLT